MISFLILFPDFQSHHTTACNVIFLPENYTYLYPPACNWHIFLVYNVICVHLVPSHQGDALTSTIYPSPFLKTSSNHIVIPLALPSIGVFILNFVLMLSIYSYETVFVSKSKNFVV